MEPRDRDDELRLKLTGLSQPAPQGRGGITGAAGLTGRVLTGQTRKSAGPDPRNAAAAQPLTREQATQNIAANSTIPQLSGLPQQSPQAAQAAQPTRYDPGFEAFKQVALTRNPQPIAPPAIAPTPPPQAAAPPVSPIAPDAALAAPVAPQIGLQPPQQIPGLEDVSALSQGLGGANTALQQPAAPPVVSPAIQTVAAQQAPDQLAEQVQQVPAQIEPPQVPNAIAPAAQPVTPSIQAQGGVQDARVIPKDAIQLIRGGPQGTRVSYLTKDASGGFTNEVNKPLAKPVTDQLAKAARGDVVAGAQARALGGPALNETALNAERKIQSDNALQRTEIQANEKLQREENQARISEAEAKAQKPQIEKLTDEFGQEQLVIVENGKQRPVEQSDGTNGSNANRVAAEREIRREVPDATDEEIEAFLNKKFGR